MRKTALFFGALLLAVTMTGCGQKQETEQRTEFINVWSDCYKNGCVLGGDKTMFLDFDTMEIAPLCAVPNCTHSDSACLAKQVTHVPIFYKDHVYFFDSNRGGVRETTEGPEFFIDSKLNRASLDSSQVEVVCRFDDSVPNIDYDGYVIHNNELYFIGDDYNPQKSEYGGYSYGNSGGNHFLCSIDLDTGKYTNYGSVYDGDKEYPAANFSSGCRLMGVHQGRLFMRYSFMKEQPEGDVITDFTAIMFEFDFDTKELKESDMPPSYFMNEEYYTCFDEETHELHIMSGEEDHVISLEEECPRGPPTVMNILNDRFFLKSGDVWVDLDDMEKHHLNLKDGYYAVAFHDGKYILIRDQRSVDAIALTEEELLALDKED